MLNQPGPVTDDIGTSALDSASSQSGEPRFNGNAALSEMLYGEHGTVSLPPH